MENNEALYFENSQQWRNWLGKEHATAHEAWLIHYKKHINKTGISYDDAVEEALCFGWIDGKMQGIDEEKFMIRYSPRKVKSIWSKLNKEKALRLIESGRMTDAGMAKIEEARENGYWDSAYTNRKTGEKYCQRDCWINHLFAIVSCFSRLYSTFCLSQAATQVRIKAKEPAPQAATATIGSVSPARNALPAV